MSEDGGSVWQTVGSWLNDGGTMAVSSHNSDIIFCVGNYYVNSVYHLGISHSSDGGITWEHDTVDTGGRAWTVAFDPIDANRVYVGGDTGYSYPNLYVSTDLGTTWNSSRTGLVGRVNVITPDPYDNQIVYCGTNSGVFKSSDGGQTWNQTTCTRQVRAMAIDTTDTDIIYAGTYGYGVYLSTDEGATWDTINTGLTSRKILSLALHSGEESMLFVGTEGGAVFRTVPPTAVEKEIRPTINGQRFTFSVSPNPCYGAAKISVQISEASKVSLRIYDRCGRQIANFGNHPLLPGQWNWQWDTRQVANGIYFYELTVDGVKTTSKAIVVKK
ncbi:MAG: T9SS type A sorting domain-containing protein [candidate division WOR-3 bacterium]|nr:T9SS type A sorting domain-containing protein [candidate division WOR-3 bacterium]